MRALAALGLILVVAAGILIGLRVVTFLGTVGNVGVDSIGKEVEPPAGSIPYKLNHGQRVNVLLLGYGGAENDSPWLTDSIMVVSIDPTTKRVMEVSIPRDMLVDITYGPGKSETAKINVAYEIGMDDSTYPGKSSRYRGREGGGHLAMDTVGKVTGLKFDGFVGMDFKAFRDVVNALGGVDVTMDTALHDCHYPDYHDGFLNGGVPVGYRCPSPTAGILFRAGPQHINGEQALELSRSRDADQPEQSTDFGRARRQQMIVNAIRKKAVSVNGLTKAPQLMSALEKNYISSLDIADLKAIYDWGGKLPDSAVGHFGITQDDFVQRFYLQRGTCGDFYADLLCPIDPSFKTLHAFFENLFVDPKVLAEKAPVEVANASVSVDDMGERVNAVLRPLGFAVADPLRRRAAPASTVYDFSGGKYPLTAQWMATYFGAQVVTINAATAAPATAPPSNNGVVVVLGRDYALKWTGQG